MGSYPGILRQIAHNTCWVPRRCGLPGVGMRVRVCARACVHFPTCTCMSTPSKVHVCACTHVCPPNLWEFRGNEEGGREGWGPMAAMAQPRYMQPTATAAAGCITAAGAVTISGAASPRYRKLHPRMKGVRPLYVCIRMLICVCEWTCMCMYYLGSCN